MTRAELKEWASTPYAHYECEDCWYSCATLTCDEHRRSDKCDCGADKENEARQAVLELLKSCPE